MGAENDLTVGVGVGRLEVGRLVGTRDVGVIAGVTICGGSVGEGPGVAVTTCVLGVWVGLAVDSLSGVDVPATIVWSGVDEDVALGTDVPVGATADTNVGIVATAVGAVAFSPLLPASNQKTVSPSTRPSTGTANHARCHFPRGDFVIAERNEATSWKRFSDCSSMARTTAASTAGETVPATLRGEELFSLANRSGASDGSCPVSKVYSVAPRA